MLEGVSHVKDLIDDAIAEIDGCADDILGVIVRLENVNSDDGNIQLAIEELESINRRLADI